MTAIEVYTGQQFDSNKLEAPSILIDEFNYFVNKAINQYVNKRYNLAESKQQLTDDLQSICKTIIIYNDGKVTDRRLKTTDSTQIVKTDLGWMFDLPCKYLHVLGCVVKFDECNIKTAKRLTADIHGGIQANSYLKPSIERPYFNVWDNSIEIRAGKEIFESVTLDYLSEPDKIVLTQEQLDLYLETGQDTSQTLQFREYINYEILRELTALILEMTSDPRLQTNIPITQSIN